MTTVARVNSARVGSARLGSFAPFVDQFFIDGTEETDNIEWSSVEWFEQRPRSTLTFTLRAASAGVAPPLEGQLVEYSLGSRANDFFRGNISEVVVTNPAPGQEGKKRRWVIRAVDKGRIFNKVKLTRTYGEQSASIVAMDIITASGLTARVAPSAPDISELSFRRSGRTSSMQRLADLVGWSWWIDQDRVFFQDPAANSLTATNLVEPISGWKPVSRRSDGVALVTRAAVEGKGSPTTAASAAGATSLAVEDTTPFQELKDAATADSFFKVTAVIGTDEFTFTNVSAASGPGNITGISSQDLLNAYDLGEDVAILVTNDDTGAQSARAALDGTDGIYVGHYADPELDPTGCRKLGAAELRKDLTLDEFTFTTQTDESYRAGASFTINLPVSFDIDTSTYVVRSQRTKWIRKGVWRRTVMAQKSGIGLASLGEIIGGGGLL